jgi:GNAT superfamily N-acetyltransferase
MREINSSIRIIHGSGETSRLIIRDSNMEECDTLQKINEASDYIEKWVGWKTPKDYVVKAMSEGNLPPGGKKEFFKLMSIILKETGVIIGVVELYHGYPIADSLCIGWLFIHQQHQKQGYAKEVFRYITEEAGKAGYKKIRLGVHLKNWPALRFWHKVGFDRIVDIEGDEEHSDNTNATVILEFGLNK